MDHTISNFNGTQNPAFATLETIRDHSDQPGQDLPGKDESKGKKGKKKFKKKLRKCEKQLRKEKTAAKKSKLQYEADQKLTDVLIRNAQLKEQLRCSDIIMECCNPEIAKRYRDLRDGRQENEADDAVQC